MTDPKSQYRKLCREEKTIPVFSKDWWLDAVCGENSWDVALVEKDGSILASLPYRITKKSGFTMLNMPLLTQKLGPWIRYSGQQSEYDRLGYEKEVMTELIGKLPRFSFFNQRFDYKITNWLPFYWKGFSQTTMYTYYIPDISDPEAAVAQFSSMKKRNIRKAEKSVEVKEDLAAPAFFEHYQSCLAKQGKKIIYTKDFFERIYTAAYAAGSGKTFYAVNADGKIESALFIIWDAESAYYLTYSIDPDFRANGSPALLVSNAIHFLAGKTKRFDFEGSMIEPVEASYRQFGTVQAPYSQVRKINAFPLKFIFLARELFNRNMKA